MERMEFLIEGSRGDEYSVTFHIDGTKVTAFCTCQAGENGQYCKHRFGIIGGDITNLLSGNDHDVSRLEELMRGSELETAYKRVLEAEAVYQAAKKELDAAKKALAKVMHR